MAALAGTTSVAKTVAAPPPSFLRRQSVLIGRVVTLGWEARSSDTRDEADATSHIRAVDASSVRSDGASMAWTEIVWGELQTAAMRAFGGVAGTRRECCAEVPWLFIAGSGSGDGAVAAG